MELPLTCLVTIKTVCVVFMDRKTISVLFAELSILLFADSNFCPETEAIISSLVCQLFHSWIAILFWIVTDTLVLSLSQASKILLKSWQCYLTNLLAMRFYIAFMISISPHHFPIPLFRYFNCSQKLQSVCVISQATTPIVWKV